MRITELLERQSNNNKMALRHGDNSITYNDWYRYSDELSQRINTVKQVDTMNIALFLPNSIHYAIAYFAVLFSDRILIPIGIQAKELEIVSTIEYCEVDLIITDSRHRDFLVQALQEYHHRVIVYVIDTDETLVISKDKRFIAKSEHLVQNGSVDDVAIMLHTSGTTSNPKRVMLTHNNLIHNVESNIDSLKLTQDDKVLIALPMFFGYCNTAQFLTHVYLGATIVILDSVFLPKQFFQIVEKEKITNFTGVPSMLLMLLEYRYADRYDYESLRYICFGGGKMPVDQLKILIKKYPSIGFVQTYGQTECSPRVTALLPEYAIIKTGSVGIPILHVEVKIVNPEDNELPANEMGEIIVRGKNIMKGYYKRPDITSETIRNGWLHTGDLGYLDGDGFLYLTGRIKNIIISGGINVYPEEIEQLLLQHESVEDACVVGEEHKLLGEVPVAKVVLKHEISQVELKLYCTEKLADYKVPSRFDIVDSLPKTYNGKTKRY